MRKLYFKYIGILSFMTAQAQTLTIDQSYKLAVENYPLIKQYQLIEKVKNIL